MRRKNFPNSSSEVRTLLIISAIPKILAWYRKYRKTTKKRPNRGNLKKLECVKVFNCDIPLPPTTNRPHVNHFRIAGILNTYIKQFSRPGKISLSLLNNFGHMRRVVHTSSKYRKKLVLVSDIVIVPSLEMDKDSFTIHGSGLFNNGLFTTGSGEENLHSSQIETWSIYPRW